MFTGIIEDIGVIANMNKMAGRWEISLKTALPPATIKEGDSISVDGVCLTVAKFIRGAFVADVSDETMARTTLGGVHQGTKVNLERALRLSDRLGGHLVTGHIDGVGRVLLRHPAGNSVIYQFQVPRELLDFVVQKGSIAIDGISLTVAQIRGDSIAAAVVPHTEEVTTLRDKPIGSPVNVEADMMAKYVKKFVDIYALGEDDDQPTRRGLGDLLRDFTDGK